MVLKKVEDTSQTAEQPTKELRHMTQVVRELPTQPVRSMQTTINGEEVIVEFVTVEEALQELLNAGSE